MDSIWQNCPLDLVRQIISHATDETAQDAWCAATKGNSILRRTALHYRWSTITIKHYDLLEKANGSTRWPTVFAEAMKDDHSIPLRYTNFPRFLVTDSSSTGDEPPAAFVRHLCLDLQSLTEEHYDPYTSSLTFEEWVATQPLIDSVYLTLTALVPYLPKLETVHHYGSMPQEVLDGIMKNIVAFAPTQFRKLTFRQGIQPRHKFRSSPPKESDSGPYDNTGLNLHWGDLGELVYLRDLSINCLTHDEGSSLVDALEQLQMLQKLTVRTAEPVSLNVNILEEKSPAESFLASAFLKPKQPFCRLPNSLEEFCFHDSPWPAKSMAIDHANFAKSNGTCLRTLRVDFGDPALAASLVSSFSSCPIEELWIVGSKELSWRDEAAEAADPACTALITDLISKFKDTLRIINLTNAWDCHLGMADHLNNSLEIPEFKVEELIMETKQQYFYESQILPEPVNENLLIKDLRGFRRSDTNERWGCELQRIRIEQVKLDALDLGEFWNPSLAHLRILVLCPAEIARPSSREDGVASGSHKSVEDRVVRGLVDQTPPESLRVVVVAGTQFWLERGEETTESTEGRANIKKIWRMDNAKDDSEQGRLIIQHLSKRDSEFLALGPSREAGAYPSFGPRGLQRRLGNRMVLRRHIE